jgi:succinate dehydrogenase/fumarate reductase flavoprotein subunit
VGVADMNSEDPDVIVIGGGGSGLAAAIEASHYGRKVLLLEKVDKLGGTTAWSVGSISATATPHQLAKGIKDAPAGHFEDLPKFHAALECTDNPVLRKILTDRVPDTLRWLMGLGVQFFGPMPEPPHQRPRMHNVIPNSRSYIAHCRRAALRQGVEIRTGVRVTELLQENGRVIGVAATDAQGNQLKIRARGAVVLASGDYSASSEYKRDLISEEVSRIQPVNVNNTGDGHRMASKLGAYVINGHLAHVGVRFLPPARRSIVQALPASTMLSKLIKFSMDKLPQWLLRPFLMKFLVTVMEPSETLFKAGAVLVSPEGDLISDWDGNRKAALSARQEHTAYVLLDSCIIKMFDAWPNYISTAPGVAYAYLNDYRVNRPDLYHAGRSINDVATANGLDPAKLKKAVDQVNERRYNGDANGGPLPFEDGPMLLLGPLKLFITFTDGGLAVDDSLRVIRRDGTPIAGLYAAGSAGQGGLMLEGHGHHLGWAFTSGRLAGRNAAFESTS